MYTYDTAVIGGGVIGCAIAYYLAKEGCDVALLEREGVGSGASSKCDGNLQVGDSPSGIDTEFVMKSLSLFEGVSADLDIDIQWRPMDSLFVFETEEEIEVGRRLVDRKKADGCRMHLLDRNELFALEPNLAQDLRGGILTEGDGAVNPMLLAAGLAHKAVHFGAEVRTWCPVTGIRPMAGRFEIDTEKGAFYANRVVNAAGCGAPEIGAMVGLPIPVIPRQGQILVIEDARGYVSRTITEFGYIMTKQENREFVRNVPPEMEEFGVAAVVEPTEAGTLLVGSSRRFAGYELRSDDRVVRAMAQRAIRFLPGMAGMNMIRTYTGLRPYIADHRSILSATPLVNYYIAAGHEGSGITLSLESGKVMAELLMELPLSLDLTPFRYTRFLEQAGR